MSNDIEDELIKAQEAYLALLEANKQRIAKDKELQKKVTDFKRLVNTANKEITDASKTENNNKLEEELAIDKRPLSRTAKSWQRTVSLFV